MQAGVHTRIWISPTDSRSIGGYSHGQVIYRAVAKEEPAGKPLTDCRLVSVKLTLCHEVIGRCSKRRD
ncbi:MAG: DUF1670 domain-containing protein [Theionarchaea archaeon]|nr:DUF1670 domain-containing protein [Theionarchaea archaeon]